jgi:hypothetical protein
MDLFDIDVFTVGYGPRAGEAMLVFTVALP